MSLTVGQSLTYYEILGPLGAGGMGEVYRARDTRLDREVAIKVLPEELADDEDRLRRFEREAKTLASLNHPNVAGIHGVDEEGEVCFLALELVPGEDLEERLKRGALPLDEALDICRQIAEGLEAAHEAGVVHRDLKPANVRVTRDGIVKILDFGLAKPIRPQLTREGTTSAESDSFLLTEEGLVLGTPTYMSPEQARGKPIDRRTDIWAFGCVLYECLTGKRAFEGDSFSDLMVAILEREPDWDALPAATPTRVRRLLERTLTKDPRSRLRDIGEARVLLQDQDRGGNEQQAEVAQARRSPAVLLVAGAVLGAALGALALHQLGGTAESADELAAQGAQAEPVRRFALPPALNEEGDPIAWEEPYLSPDGKYLAAATQDGLVVRALDSLESTLIPDTDGLANRGSRGRFAWSPDSASIAYCTKDSIIRVTPKGHSPVPLYSTRDETTRLVMLTWLDDGRIVFGSVGDGGSRLHSIPERGGAVTDVAVLGENMTEGHLHSLFPVPGGRFVAVLHSFLGNTFSVLTEGDEGVRELYSLPGESITSAFWAPGNYLLLNRGVGEQAEDVWAVPLSMDPLEVAGDPFFVRGGVKAASVSMDGTLAYVESATAQHQLAWWSADGEVESIGRVHDKRVGSPYLSWDQQSVFYTVGGSPPLELWRHDLRRELTTEVASESTGVMWASTLPDGRVAYSSIDFSADGITTNSYLLPASGRGESELWLDAGVLDRSESHALASVFVGDHLDVYSVDLTTLERRPFRIGDEEFSFAASISPSGEWAVLASGGKVLLTRFPSGEGEWQVSPDGGWDADFSSDGTAIHFVNERDVYRVSLQTEPDVVLGMPELLGHAEEGMSPTGRSHAKSGRFLASQEMEATGENLVVVLGWTSELMRR